MAADQGLRHVVHIGDCVERMADMPSNSIDAVVCDPPYGLSAIPDAAEVLRHWLAGDDYVHKGSGFMGNSWDSFVPGPTVWKEALRVAKPGAHLVVFAGTRTVDLMAMAIRLAGWHIRDQIMWVYATGMPKGLNVAKGIDAHLGVEPEVVGEIPDRWAGKGDVLQRATQAAGDTVLLTEPTTEEAKRWRGWNTALKPSVEPIILARKPLDGTVVENVLVHGTGAINVDATRVPMNEADAETIRNMGGFGEAGYERTPGEALNLNKTPMPTQDAQPHEGGRWPANLVLDSEAAAVLDAQSGELPSRFFYCAKSSRAERNAGLESFPERAGPSEDYGTKAQHPLKPEGEPNLVFPVKNPHPTVKPIDLMRWLVRMVTPPGGRLCDPFVGSGTTGCAAVLEGFDFVGIEREPEYAEIARARIEAWANYEGAEDTAAALKGVAREDDHREHGQMSILD